MLFPYQMYSQGRSDKLTALCQNGIGQLIYLICLVPYAKMPYAKMELGKSISFSQINTNFR